MANLNTQIAMIVFIRCPHWYCSMSFLTELGLFQHYRSAHRHGEPFAPVLWSVPPLGRLSGKDEG
jgi:hypothetical protein